VFLQLLSFLFSSPVRQSMRHVKGKRRRKEKRRRKRVFLLRNFLFHFLLCSSINSRDFFSLSPLSLGCLKFFQLFPLNNTSGGPSLRTTVTLSIPFPELMVELSSFQLKRLYGMAVEDCADWKRKGVKGSKEAMTTLHTDNHLNSSSNSFPLPPQGI